MFQNVGGRRRRPRRATADTDASTRRLFAVSAAARARCRKSAGTSRTGASSTARSSNGSPGCPVPSRATIVAPSPSPSAPPSAAPAHASPAASVSAEMSARTTSAARASAPASRARVKGRRASPVSFATTFGENSRMPPASVLRATLEYDGGRYRGWQAQVNARTVQGELVRACREALGVDVKVNGAGRTDAGVHAFAQVASLHGASVKAADLGKLRQDLNDRLPPDIHVLRLDVAPPSFHARHSAGERIYRYRISRRRTAFGKRYVYWVKARIGASHFLWKMVRRLTGTLLEVGRGRLDAAGVRALLESRSGKPAEWTAPPSGLFLESVAYPGDPPPPAIDPFRPGF